MAIYVEGELPPYKVTKLDIPKVEGHNVAYGLQGEII